MRWLCSAGSTRCLDRKQNQVVVHGGARTSPKSRLDTICLGLNGKFHGDLIPKERWFCCRNAAEAPYSSLC
jgi:hypothetical protein